MSEEKAELVDLTIDELLGFKNSNLVRKVTFEITVNGKAEKMERRVIFRRLTYSEIDNFVPYQTKNL